MAGNVRATPVTDRVDRILLRGMRFEGRIGASDEEREAPQLLEVDVELETDLEAAARTDELGATIDYGKIIVACRSVVEDGERRLLEALAGRLVETALAIAPTASAVTVRVRKLAVPLDADLDYAQVELRRERGAW